MISVVISINGHPITGRSAVNTLRKVDGKSEYRIDDGSIVLHDPADGAVVLAKKLLDTIYVEPKPVS
jgi:hypothetical protein